jgi:hypothetical protein
MQLQQHQQPDYATMAAMGALGIDPSAHFDEAYYGKSEEFSQMVASTLQQALTEQGGAGIMMTHHLGGHHHHMEAHDDDDEDDDDEDDDRPQVVSTAELLGPH